MKRDFKFKCKEFDEIKFELFDSIKRALTTGFTEYIILYDNSPSGGEYIHGEDVFAMNVYHMCKKHFEYNDLFSF